MHHDPHVAEIECRGFLSDMIRFHDRTDRVISRMLHNRNSAVLPLCVARKKQKPIQLRFLRGKAQILLSESAKGLFLRKPCIHIGKIPLLRCIANRCPYLVHGIEIRKNRPGRYAEFSCNVPRRQGAGAPFSDDIQCGIHDLVFCKLRFWRHFPTPFDALIPYFL